jgi:hypothetical protein
MSEEEMKTAAYLMTGVKGIKRSDRNITTRSAEAATSWRVGDLFRASEDQTFLEKLPFESRKVKVRTLKHCGYRLHSLGG